MGTNVAVIVGTVVAGIVAQRWKDGVVDGAPAGTSAWLPGIAMAVFVTLGFLTCLTLPKLKAQNPSLPVNLNPFSTYISTAREMAKSPLLAVCAAWTFFYFVAAMVLLILPDYSSYLQVRDDETSLLMAALGVAIGVGCVTAAYLDTPARRPLFVPIGAGGLAVGFALLGFAPASFAVTMTLLALTGLVAGFYIIPLQSMLQALAPDDLRGRVLGTANGFSFLMGAVGSGLFFALRQLDMPSNRVFLVIGALCAVVALVTVLWLRRGKATR
jgi:sugar phosphate permease